MTAVVARNLVVEAPGRQWVRGVSFEVEEATSLGIVGPNGSGKSLLLRCLATLQPPRSGRASVFGYDVVRDARKARPLVGYVPEEAGVYAGLTVWQQLDFLARCQGLGGSERSSAIATLLEVVDLFGLREASTTQLSRGQRRRLALASALVHNPGLLLLDDPLGGLDGKGRLELVEVLRELSELGATLIVSSPSLADLAQLCDRLAYLSDGRLLWQGLTKEALLHGSLEDPRLDQAFVALSEQVST